MSRNYKTAEQMGHSHQDMYRWGEARNTDVAVATAIHAIADDSRSAESIWEDPTGAEAAHIEMAVQDYVRHGDYDAGEFRWGDYRFEIADESQ